MSYTYDFARPSVTATVMLFNRSTEEFLAAKRGPNTSAFPNAWSLPGGFLNAKIDKKDWGFYCLPKNQIIHPGETVEQTAIREVKEETNIDIEEDELQVFTVRSNPDTDPRCHVVNICYLAILDDDRFDDMEAGDDIVELKLVTDPDETWAFNHAEIALLGAKFAEEYCLDT